MIDLDKLKELAQKATPGPWARGCDNDTGAFDDYFSEWEMAGPAQFHDRNGNHDADYVAAVSPDVTLSLLDRLKLAEDAIAQLADLKRYDPNRGRSNAGRTVTINVPAMNLAALDAVIRGMKP